MNKVIFTLIALLTLTGCEKANEWDKEAAKATCVEEGFDDYLQIFQLKGSSPLDVGRKNIVVCPDRKRHVINYDLIKRSK